MQTMIRTALRSHAPTIHSPADVWTVVVHRSSRASCVYWADSCFRGAKRSLSVRTPIVDWLQIRKWANESWSKKMRPIPSFRYFQCRSIRVIRLLVYLISVLVYQSINIITETHFWLLLYLINYTSVLWYSCKITKRANLKIRVYKCMQIYSIFK